MPYRTLVRPQDVLHHPQWLVIDCRFDLQDPEAGLRAWRKSHVPGACYAHMEEDLSGPVDDHSGRHPLPDPVSLCRTLGYWGIEAGVQVVVYDQSDGAYAARLWWLLRWLGHDAVAILDGGWERWIREGHPTSAALELPRGVVFDGLPKTDWVISTENLQRHLQDDHWRILDVRDGQRFRGEIEPIDPVAGHIPGARNLPYREFVDQNGEFLPAHRLRSRLLRGLGGIPTERAVFMCGSGVSACHGLMAMELAALSGARLYAGSWSEWVRDSGRPVEVGA